MTPDMLLTVMEATWGPASTTRLGPWNVRNGLGGGKRVSATTAAGDWQDTDIPVAEAAMAALHQPALFLIREGVWQTSEAST